MPAMPSSTSKPLSRRIPVVALRLELLHAQLTEREEHVDHLLHHVRALGHELQRFGLQSLEAWICLLRRDRGREDGSEEGGAAKR